MLIVLFGSLTNFSIDFKINYLVINLFFTLLLTELPSNQGLGSCVFVLMVWVLSAPSGFV